MKKKITVLAAFCIVGSWFTSHLYAQHAIGLGAGNYNPSYSVFTNPANAYPDRNRLYLNFWGAQMGFSNNFLNYEAPFGLVRMGNGNYPDTYKNIDGSLAFNQDWVTLDAQQNNKLYYLNKVYGPSAFFRADRDVAIGFGLNGVSGLSADGIGIQAAHLLRYGMDTAGFTGPFSPVLNQKYSQGAFSINADRYQEWFFSLAGVTRDKGPHFVKWGGTGKVLLGMGGAGLRADGLDYSVTNGNQFNFTAQNAAYYHSDDESASRALSHPLGLKFDFPKGAGLGIDAGFVYEYRPDSRRKTVRDWWLCSDEFRNDYLWKFGASVTDLGFLSYSGVKQTLNNSVTKSWNIQNNILDNRVFGQDETRFSAADNGFFQDSAVNAGVNDRYLVTTPATFNAQFDLSPAKNFYVGLNWQQSLKSAASNGLKNTSYLSLIPRFETEHAEIGLPITLTRDYTALNVGLYGRLGPVILGTDNLAGLASYAAGNATKNANLYFGVRFQIPTCGWYEYEPLVTDTVYKTDSTYKTDTLSFWRVDTVYKVKTVVDTIRIQSTDTIIKYRNTVVDPQLEKKQEEITKKQAELKKKEDDLNTREKALANKEKVTVQSDNCAQKIMDLEDQLKRERDNYAKLNTLYQDSKGERDRLRINIENLQKEIDLLKNDNATLKLDQTNRQNEIIRLNNEIKRLKATGTPCGAQVKTLDSLLVVEQTRNAELEKENTGQKAQVTGLKKDNDDKQKRIADLEKQIADLKAAGGDKDACEKKVADLQKQLDAEKSHSAALEKQLEDLRKEYLFEIEKNKKLQADLNNCGSSEESAKLKAELEAQKKKCVDLSIQIKTLESEKANLQNENSTLKAKVSGLEKELADTKASLDAAAKQIAALQADLKKCNEAGNADALKAEIESLKKQNSEKDAVITGLKKDKSTLEADLAGAKAKIADLEKQLSECSGKDCSDCEEKLAQSKAEYNAQVNKYNALYEEYQAMNDERTKLKAKIADLEAKLKNCSGSSDDNAKLQAEISKLKLTITELNGEVDSKQRSLDDLQEQYDKLSGEKAALQKQVTTMQTQIKALQAQVVDLQEQLKKCQEGTSPGGEGG